MFLPSRRSNNPKVARVGDLKNLSLDHLTFSLTIHVDPDWDEESETGKRTTDLAITVDGMQMPLITKEDNLTRGNGGDLLVLKTVLRRMGLDHRGHSPMKTSKTVVLLPAGQEFGVLINNKESRDNDPAVLIVIVSPEGSSSQVLRTRGETIGFNNQGMVRGFTVERDIPLRIYQVSLKQKEPELLIRGFDSGRSLPIGLPRGRYPSLPADLIVDNSIPVRELILNAIVVEDNGWNSQLANTVSGLV